MISVDSPDRTLNNQSALESTPNEAGASLEKEILTRGPPNVDEIGERAPSRVDAAPMLLPRPVDTELNRNRLPDRLLLSTYVPLQERIHPPMGMVALDPEGALEIIHRWSPFNQAESPVAHMRDLYPNYFHVPVAARAK